MAQLLKVEKTGGSGNKLMFKAVFLGIPVGDDYVAAQMKAGYHPAGYGGPSGTVSKPLDGGKYEATFWCYASSD